MRWLLKEGLTSPLFGPAMKLGQAVRAAAAGGAEGQGAAPRAGARAHRWPTREHARKVLMLAGCVQPAMMPNINSATARVLDAAGIQTLVADDAGCCGAIRTHLNDHDGGLADMRRNIDAWWPLVEATGGGRGDRDERVGLRRDGARNTATRCAHDAGLCREGAAHRRADARPERAAARAGAALKPQLRRRRRQRRRASPSTRRARCSTASSCAAASRRRCARSASTSQLRANEAHLCCGSAGTYSVLQPELAYALRDRKLGAPRAAASRSTIVSANIGCIQHLQSGTDARRCGTGSRCWIRR